MKKTILSEANSVFKRHWWKFLIIDSLFLAMAFIFFIYTRARIKLYFLQISQYAGQIASIQQVMQQNGAEGMLQMEELLAIIGPIASQISFFAFFIAPLVIFILWCIFQAPNYNLIARGKLFSFTHYIRFVVFTAPFYIAGIYMLSKILGIVEEKMANSLADWRFYVLGIGLFFSSYCLHACYGFTLNTRYRDIVRNGWCVLKRIHRLLLPFMLYAMLGFFVLAAMINFYLKWITGVANSILIAVLPVLALLLLLSWARAFFTLKAMKCESA